MALWRVRATVDDRPGFLAVLTASLALKSVNILAVQVHTTEAGAVDDFLVDAPDQLTGVELLAAVARGRGRDAWVARTDAYDLVDPPSHALGLANRLVQDPEALGGVLGTMVGGAVSWRPSASVAGYGVAGTTMRLPDPSGGCYLVTRTAPDFTPAEYARAQALVDLAATAGRQAAARTTLLLADGTEVTVRLAGPDDLDAVRAMHERCSATSRCLSFSRSRGFALLALSGDVVAVARLVGEGVLAEATILVEDAWQRRGIGTALLRRLVTLAADSGYAALTLHTPAENSALLRTLVRLGRPYTVDRDDALLTITMPLDRSVPATEGSESPAVPGVA